MQYNDPKRDIYVARCWWKIVNIETKGIAARVSEPSFVRKVSHVDLPTFPCGEAGSAKLRRYIARE